MKVRYFPTESIIYLLALLAGQRGAAGATIEGMKVEPRSAILDGMLLILGLLDLFVVVDSHSPSQELPFGLLAMAIVPAQVTLLAWWLVFGATSLASRIAGSALVTGVLLIVMFRAHLAMTSGSAFGSAVFSATVMGSHFGFSVGGFWLGRRLLGLRLISDPFNRPTQEHGKLQFGLRQLLAWTAGAAVLALFARYALDGCVWAVGAIDSYDVFYPALLLGFVALLASPLAIFVLWLDDQVQRPLRILSLYFCLICMTQSVVMGVVPRGADLEMTLCNCCGNMFLNAFQLLPIAFVFWLVRMSGNWLVRISDHRLSRPEMTEV